MPQAKDIYKVSAELALDDISKVNEEMYKHFLPYAKTCIDDHGGDFERALSSALAVIGGHLKIVKGRSLLSSLEGYTAVLTKAIRGKINTKSYVLKIVNSDLEEHLDPNEKNIFKEIKLTKDGDALIDMPSKYADILIKNNSSFRTQLNYSIPTELPELEDEDDYKKRINDYSNGRDSGRHDNYRSSGRDSGRNNNGGGYDDFQRRRSGSRGGGFRSNRGGRY